MIHYLPLILIPICALLNHWGGQSTVIPNPRITCRVIGIAAAFGITTWFSGITGSCIIMGISLPHAICLWLMTTVGMALMFVFGYDQGFMCFPLIPGSILKLDRRNYSSTGWLAHLTNWIIGVNSLTTLTQAQAVSWGTWYLTFRGLFIYPLFALFGWLLTPWAYAIGLAGALMGMVYKTSFSSTDPLNNVVRAEWRFGALIGTMFAAILLLH